MPNSVTLEVWRQRLIDLDLNPDRDAVNYPIVKHTGNLEVFKGWWAFPFNPHATVNDVRADKVASIPDALLRRFVSEHVANQRIFTDPAVIEAVEERVKRFYLYVQAAPDITITAQDPLLINNTGVITIYNNVTIRDGGFIRITLPTKFECQNLTKVQGGGGESQFDVFSVGRDGGNSQEGTTSGPPGKADNGKKAECDCCGGAVK